MESKWFAIMVIGIFMAIGVSLTVDSYSKEQTKQAALQALENGADEQTVNRILNK